jgi:hypothetical protein
VQAVKLSPLNLRPLLRIRPGWNAKAIGLVASGYIRLAAIDADEAASTQARRWLGWLSDHVAGPGTAWGYPFDVQTRVFAYRGGTPNTVATSFVAQAFLDAWELLGDDKASDMATRAAEGLVSGMLTEEGGRTYFRYLPGEGELVHNANLLACAVVARTARLSGDRSLLDPVWPAVETSLRSQRADGAFPYADAPGHEWIDNFHTGYVLDSLAECARVIPKAQDSLARGAEYWERELFLADGTPKYRPNRKWPLDGHCYATAIDTWLALAPWRPSSVHAAERVARLLVEQMLDPSGFVYFQRRRGFTNRVPFVRWTTAPTFRALAGLVGALQAESDRFRQTHANLG